MLLIVLCVVFTVVIPQAVQADERLVVGVSIYPEKYFVERIAGDHADVVLTVGDGYNPVTYEPKPKQLASLSKAKIYFLIGVPFENKWTRILVQNNPELQFVSLAKEIKLRHFETLPSSKHMYGDHDHRGNIDPHFWLNPKMVVIAAKTILDALIRNDPEREPVYKKNYLNFVSDLEALDKFIRSQLSSVKQRNFAVFHPSWGYFAEAYGLNQIAIEVQNRQSGAKTLNATINAIKEKGLKTIFVQKQFSDVDASMIAREAGCQIVHIDPLAENYIENMKTVTRLFVEALT